MNRDAVRSEARHIADDARETRDLSDAGAECLRDLLRSDEAFGQLVTAQRAAVSVDADDHDVDEPIEALARKGATPLGTAIDLLVDDRIADAQAVVALTKAVDTDLPWGQALKLHQAGVETVDDLRDAEQADLVDAGVPRSTAARVTAAVETEDGDAA